MRSWGEMHHDLLMVCCGFGAENECRLVHGGEAVAIQGLRCSERNTAAFEFPGDAEQPRGRRMLAIINSMEANDFQALMS